MLFGRGGRNFWVARIALLFIVLTAGAVFHYHGAAYWTVRGLYYALDCRFHCDGGVAQQGKAAGSRDLRARHVLRSALRERRRAATLRRFVPAEPAAQRSAAVGPAG